MKMAAIPGKLVVRVWEGQLSTPSVTSGRKSLGGGGGSSSSNGQVGDEITCKVDFDGHVAYCTSSAVKSTNDDDAPSSSSSALIFRESQKDAILDVFEYHGATKVTISLFLKRTTANGRLSKHRDRILRMVTRTTSSGLAPSRKISERSLALRETVPGHFRAMAIQAADAYESPSLYARSKLTFVSSSQWWGLNTPSPPSSWKEYWPSIIMPLPNGGQLKLGVLFVPFISPERCIGGYTELHKAAFVGDAKLVSTLLLPRSGSSAALAARTRDALQATPLDIAAMRGHLEVALEIIADSSSSHPIFVSSSALTSLHRKTSLHLAVEGGNATLVSCLADHFGAHAQTVSVKLLQPPPIDASGGLWGAGSSLEDGSASHTVVEESVPILDVTDENGWTALMLACANKTMAEAVGRLVEAGANLEIANKQGDTALIIACRLGNVDCAISLLKSTNQTSTETQQPSHTNPPGSKASLARPNKANHAGDRALDRACSFGSCPELIRALLEACAVPALRRLDGSTALHLAAQTGSRENCEELVGWLDRERARMASSTGSLSEFVGTAIAQSIHLVLIRDSSGKFASDYAFSAGHVKLGEWLRQLEARDAKLFMPFSQGGGGASGDEDDQEEHVYRPSTTSHGGEEEKKSSRA